MLKLHPIPALQTNYIWVLHSFTAPKHVVLVDPGQAQPALNYLAEHDLSLAALLITHHHHDHVNGIAELIAEHPCPVYAGANEPIAACDHPLQDGEVFTLPKLELDFTALHIPGHTHGHTAFYGHEIVFTGDTLFAAGCGRLFEGTAAQLYASLQKLAQLPMETQVYCGHEYTEQNLRFGLQVEPDNVAMQSKLVLIEAIRAAGECTLPSSLADEMNSNIFYRAHLPQVRAAAENYAGCQLNTPEEVFAVLREWKNSA